MTSVRYALPAVAGVDEACGASAAGGPLPADGPSLRILIVEDDALIGLLLGDMLRLLGHEVCAIEATESGAVKAAAGCKPDMMIVDAQLREGNGISAVDSILKSTFVPHIFVSGNRRGVLMLRPNSVVVEKPFTESDLVAAIARVRCST